MRAPIEFDGTWILPNDPRYDAERAAPMRQFDRRPLAIAMCANDADVRLALERGREDGVEVAVRSGRHSVPGYSSIDGGLVIDVSRLKGVEIDAERGRARVQPGMTAGELLPILAERGLVAIGGSEPDPSFVGLAIHGGRGLLSRRYGWASDQIRSGRLITAAGEAIEVSARENAELLFGLRGAGSNFGIVTELEVDLAPLRTTVSTGKLLYGRSEMERLVPALLEALEEGAVSDGLGVMLTFFNAGGSPVLELKLVHLDEPLVAEADLAFLGGLAEPLEGKWSAFPYAQFIRASEVPPFDRFQWAEQGSELRADRLTAALLDEADRLPEGRDPSLPNHYLSVEPFGPGFAREPELPTAVPRRRGVSVAHFSAWTGSERDQELTAWPLEAAERLREEGVGDGIPILNYNSVTGSEGVRRAYGDDAHRRLRELKARYDPENVFRRNHNVEPLPDYAGSA